MKILMTFLVFGVSVLGAPSDVVSTDHAFLRCTDDFPNDVFCPLSALLNEYGQDIQPHQIRSLVKLLVPKLADDIVDETQLPPITDDANALSFLRSTLPKTLLNEIDVQDLGSEVAPLTEVQDLLRVLDVDEGEEPPSFARDFQALLRESPRAFASSFRAFVNQAKVDERVRPLATRRLREGLKNDIMNFISNLQDKADVIGEEFEENNLVSPPPPFVNFLRVMRHHGPLVRTFVDDVSAELSLEIMNHLITVPKRFVDEM